MTERRLSPADAAWLYSEWDKNNQTVSALMWLDRDRPRRLHRHRAGADGRQVPDVQPAHPHLAQPADDAALENDPDFDISNHVEVPAPEPGTKEQLELISEQRGQLLDRERPLWKMYVIQGYDGNTTAVHARIQHSIADGWALVRRAPCATTPPRRSAPEPVDKKRRRKRDLVARPPARLSTWSAAPGSHPGHDQHGTHPKRFIEFGSEALDALETGPKGEERPRVPVRPRPGKTILHGKVSGEKKID